MILGLSGYARSGKDTAAELLDGYVRRAFADPIRAALLALNPTVVSHTRVRELVTVHGWDDAKTAYPEVRRLLQVLGTEIGRRMIADDVWVEIALRGLDDNDRVVFTDVRFPNEADAIRRLGGRVWRIERPGVTPVNTHASESALDDYPFDRVIVNDGTVEDLAVKLAAALEEDLCATSGGSSTTASAPETVNSSRSS